MNKRSGKFHPDYYVIIRICVILIVLLAPTVLHAQTGFASTDDTLDTTDIPIDGGISALVIAGIGYGSKKLYEIRKKGAAAKENSETK